MGWLTHYNIVPYAHSGANLTAIVACSYDIVSKVTSETPFCHRAHQAPWNTHRQG